MTFLPCGGALASAWSTWMLAGGAVGGAATTALAGEPAAAPAPAVALLLLLLLLPHAAAINETATTGTMNQPDDRTIIGLLGLLGVVDGRQPATDWRVASRSA